MSYQVLARKWRPRTFAQMVGQEHVVRALCNALDNDRVHHAFLFTGTRGVGKTSVARVLAKALNCERGVSSSPCGECSACQEVDAGRFVDLIEVDAASRTGVDDTRDLLDNVQYTPARGRYKVYLIDEVHMFSRSSFNALLKTLEEPPPHVKFLLATTDPRKLPATVLSRCLQFNLRRLSPGLISRHLGFILESEAIEHEATSLGLLARSADGSLRDALSLLDQAIAFCGGGLRTDAVGEMLGTIEHAHVAGLLDCLIQEDAVALLQQVETIDRLAPDYAHLLGELLILLQRIAIVQVTDQAVNDDVADPAELRRFAAAMTPEDVQLAYQIALIGKRDLTLSPDARAGFEMVLLRMLYFTPDADPGGQTTQTPSKQIAARPTAASTAGNPDARGQSSPPAARDLGPGSSARAAVAPRSGLARRALDEALEKGYRAAGSEPRDDPRPVPGADKPIAADKAAPGPVPEVAAQPAPENGAPSPPVAEGRVEAHVGPPPEASERVEPAPASTEPRSAKVGAVDLEHWHRVFAELDLDGVARELAANCILESCDGNRARFILDSKHSHLCTTGARERLDEALSRYFSAAIRCEVNGANEVADTPADRAARQRAEHQRQAERAIAEDPNVQTLMETFGATIRPRSVTPNSESG